MEDYQNEAVVDALLEKMRPSVEMVDRANTTARQIADQHWLVDLDKLISEMETALMKAEMRGIAETLADPVKMRLRLEGD